MLWTRDESLQNYNESLFLLVNYFGGKSLINYNNFYRYNVALDAVKMFLLLYHCINRQLFNLMFDVFDFFNSLEVTQTKMSYLQSGFYKTSLEALYLQTQSICELTTSYRK